MAAAPGGWTMAVIGLALCSLLVVLLRRNKSDAEVVFAVFCGSLSMTMLRPWLEHSPAWLFWAAALGGCATCNAYWLFARALFRGEGGVRRGHVLVALGIAALIVAYRVAERAEGGASGTWTAVLGAVLTLASSTMLVLAFLEALRDWSPTMPALEKRLRASFLLVFGGCVLVGTVSGGWAETSPTLAALRPTVVAICALSILIFTLWALHVRRRCPWPQRAAQAQDRPDPMVAAEDRRVAEAVLRVLECEHAYREPELKVADLAARLGCADYKISRAITQVLGERNFNRLVNRYRIAHACRSLEDADATRTVLEISLDAGFASLGPFNRAFKDALGCTPSAYRAAQRQRLQPPTCEARPVGEPVLALPQGLRD